MADRTCSIDGCGNPSRARGWCNKHYLRWKLTGNTELASKPTLEQRLWSKVNKDGPVSRLGTKCWNWTGVPNHGGYGQLRDHGRIVLAHRLSYKLINGTDAPDQVDHECHNRICVNPEHLRAATSKQNAENKSGPRINNTSGILGVSWHKRVKRWHAQVQHNGKRIHVGYFANLDEAEASVVAKRNELFTHNNLDRVA